MCTLNDYAAMKTAMSAAKDVDQYDAMLQRLQDGESITLPTTKYFGVQTPKGKESGAYMTSDDPNPLPDQTDKVGLIADMANANMDVCEPKVALKEALKIQTLDDKF